MQQLKKMVRSGNNPIVQIAKRLGELSTGEISEPNKENRISVKKPNNAYILNDHSCCEVVDMANRQNEHGNHLFSCRIYENTVALYHSLCDSRIVDVHKANLQQTTMKVLWTK